MSADMLTRDYVSWSELSTYRACPLRHHFRYVQRLPPEFVSASLLFGGAFHSAMEVYHRRLLHGELVMMVDEMLEEFWAEWKTRAETEPEIKFGKAEDVGTIGHMADRMLRAFAESKHAQTDETIIGIEEELRGDLIRGCPDLLARVDLIIDTGEALVIRDFKTARNRWSQATAESYGEQLLLYSGLASRLIPDRRLRLEFLVVTKAKTPAVELYQLQASESDIKRTINIAKRINAAASSGAVYPNPSPMNCHSCPFQNACAKWGG